MLQGLDVDINPEDNGFPHLVPKVVYEDEAIAIVDKPAGLLSIPGRTENWSVATWVRQKWPEALPAHRLDMWTQGILIVAKTNEAYHHLQRQFEEHSIKKKYLAIVEGIPEKDHGIIDMPLLCDPTNRPRQVVDYEHGKRAITEYRVLRTFKGDSNTLTLHSSLLTLLALWPHTGRTHQLRMHCAHPDGLNCPIVGDKLYGHPYNDGLCLQAQAITLIHPSTNKRMHFELPYPFDHIINNNK